MSAGLIRSDFNALRNANELAAHDSIAQLAGVKRGLDSGDDYPAKKSNSGNGNMDGSLGMSMGMPITIAGAGMGAPAPFTMGQPMGANMNENVVEVISVPDNTVGLVIGRGGEQISAIQSQSGARVQMSPDSEGTGQRQCTIQGMKAAVERAKQLIFEVINRAGNRPPPNQTTQLTSGPGQITVEVLIPANKCGLVIGKQGDTIRQLQEQSGAKMMMIQDSQEVTGTAKPLRIVGEPDKVENAKRLIENIIAGGPEGMASSRLYGQQEATARGEVVVPRASVGMIIGKGGETIKRLGLETGTKIQFKPDDDASAVERTAVITGSREQIFKATELITDLVQKALAGGGSNDTFYMHVPANKTGLVIGKGGETIKQINAESGAHCELSRDPPPNANEKVFIIKGTPYQIHHAQHIIRIKVGDVPPGTPVPPFSGPGGPTMMQPQMGFQQNPGFNGVAQFGQPMPANNQWTQQQQPAANGWQQPQQTAYYDPSQQAQAAQPQQAAYGGMAATANPYGQQQFGAPGVGQPTAAQPAAQPVQAQPTINPATGQPDYSAQWAEYYRQMGMHDQAAAIENQLKQTQAARGAVPQQAAQPQFGGYQQGAAGVPASGATTMPTFAASQPQQYPYSQPY